jgi:hypothetical protein
MDPAMGPHCHRMEHEVPDVGLLSLVHHVVMLVNMEDMGRGDAVSPPSVSPSSKCVIVSLHHYRNRMVCPCEKIATTVGSIGHQGEVVEVNIKDGIHHLLFLAERLY